MSTSDDPTERADAIFEAIDAPEADEQAKEAAADEQSVGRVERIRERVEQEELTVSTPRDDNTTPLADLAAEPTEESVRSEAEAVGDDVSDTGGVVPPDNAQ